MKNAMDRSLLWVSLLATAAYGVADENVALLLVGLVGVTVCWYVIRARDGAALPVSLTLTFTLAAVGYALVRLVGEGFKVGVFSEFVLALIMVKHLDRRTARDNAQVMLLSVFLVVGAILTSNRLFLAIIILIFVPVLCRAVVRHQIFAAGEAARSFVDLRPGPPPLREAMDLRRLVWISSLSCACISVLVFVLMPRGVGMQAFGAWGATSLGQTTAFTDEVELGRGGLISQSSTPVLDLEVRNNRGEILGSASEVFYLRGSVLDRYEDGRWTRGSGRRDLIGRGAANYVGPDSPYSVGPHEPETDLELRITLRNTKPGEHHLFTTWRPIKFESLTPTRIKHDPNDGTIIRVSPTGGKFEYVVRCRELPSSFDQQRAFRDPATFPSARIGELTRRVLEEAPEPIEIDPFQRSFSDNLSAVRAIRNYLVSNFSYSLETRTAPPDEDPIEWFLFGEDKRGHCEYFASAMAAMCRSVGLNSRVITGYVATEWNAPTGHYIVRESNAHAWVEVELKPDLWRPEDPTPTSDLTSIHQPSRSLLARARRILDTAEYAWINSVVGFNRRSRSRMVNASFDSTMTGWSEELGERLRAGGAGLALRAAGAGLIAFAISMGLGLLVSWLVTRKWGGGRRRISAAALLAWLPKRAIAPAHESLHAQLLRVLDRAGRPKPAWRPLATHAEAVASALPEGPDDETTEALARSVDAIYRERFGGRRLARAEIARTRSDIAAIAQRLRKRG